MKDRYCQDKKMDARNLKEENSLHQLCVLHWEEIITKVFPCVIFFVIVPPGNYRTEFAYIILGCSCT